MLHFLTISILPYSSSCLDTSEDIPRRTRRPHDVCYGLCLVDHPVNCEDEVIWHSARSADTLRPANTLFGTRLPADESETQRSLG